MSEKMEGELLAELISREGLEELLDAEIAELRKWFLDGKKGRSFRNLALIGINISELPSQPGANVQVRVNCKCRIRPDFLSAELEKDFTQLYIDTLLSLARSMMLRIKSLDGKPPVISLEDVYMVFKQLSCKKAEDVPPRKWN